MKRKSTFNSRWFCLMLVLLSCVAARANAPEPNGNDATSLYYWGVRYQASRDFKQSLTYFQKSADLGSAESMYKLGVLYENGLGVTQDYNQAKDWYAKAADKGDDLAMVNLGNMDENGRGVPQDYALALSFYEKAATLKNDLALYNIGSLYEKGLGVPKDYEKAIQYYHQAAAMGNAEAMNSIGSFYESGQGAEQSYPNAVHWYEKAADAGFGDAMNNLGRLYDEGFGMEPDPNKSAQWYQKAKLAGTYYYTGAAGRKTVQWFLDAAKKGDVDSMVSVAILYDNGFSGKREHDKAMFWYRKAADAGNQEAKDHIQAAQEEDYLEMWRFYMHRFN